MSLVQLYNGSSTVLYSPLKLNQFIKVTLLHIKLAIIKGACSISGVNFMIRKGLKKVLFANSPSCWEACFTITSQYTHVHLNGHFHSLAFFPIRGGLSYWTFFKNTYWHLALFTNIFWISSYFFCNHLFVQNRHDWKHFQSHRNEAKTDFAGLLVSHVYNGSIWHLLPWSPL